MGPLYWVFSVFCFSGGRDFSRKSVDVLGDESSVGEASGELRTRISSEGNMILSENESDSGSPYITIARVGIGRGC